MSKVKTDSQTDERREVKELFKSGKAFSFIGDTIQKAYKDDSTGEYFIEAIASSDQEDLVGDVMSEKALKQMEAGFVGKTVFMNHRTNVPDDVFGSITKAWRVQENGVHLLIFQIIVEQENEAAMKTYRVIAGGRTQLGTSVTVLVKNAKANPKKKNAFIYDDVEPIEHSIVGVPCNRESKTLTASASKALDLSRLVSKNMPVGDEPADQPAAENLINKGETQMNTNEIVGDADVVVSPNSGADSETAAAEVAFPLTRAALESFDARVKQFAASNSVGEIPQPVAKGMFNEAMAKKKMTLSSLFDILCAVKWALTDRKWAMQYAGATDDFDYAAEFRTACEEFAEAAVESFCYHGGFPMPGESTDAASKSAEDVAAQATRLLTTEDLNAIIEIEKSFASVAEAINHAGDDQTKKSLRSIGATMLEVAKQCGIPFCVEPTPEADKADPVEPTPEQIQKSTIFAEVKKERDDFETETIALRKQLGEANNELEIAKTALNVAVEAINTTLKQPLHAPSV